MKQSPRQYISRVVASFVILLATIFLSSPVQSWAAFVMPAVNDWVAHGSSAIYCPVTSNLGGTR